MSYLNSNIPVTIGYLDTSFLYDKESGSTKEYIPVEIFSVCSIPRRCLMFSVMTEMGSQHARVPIHYLKHEINRKINDFELDWLQLWDSFSFYFSVNKFDYLKNSACQLILKNKTLIKAKYLFTIDWCNGPDHEYGYSEIPAGHKCAHFLELSNGQYAAQPNNRIIWSDGGAWIGKKLEGHTKWKVFSKSFSCEEKGRKWTAGEDEMLNYEFNITK